MIFTESCKWIVKQVPTDGKNNSHSLNVIIICDKLLSTKTVLPFIFMKYWLVKLFKTFYRNKRVELFTHSYLGLIFLPEKNP